MILSDVIIILVRPEEAGNVGAVCRAMKNCGLSRLRLVNPAELHEGTIRARAVHAEDVWLNAEQFTSLDKAVADCSLIIGTTRRRGHKRKSVTMPPDEAAAFLKDHKGNAALLFGNERTGLEEVELDLCSLASHIPASSAFPSLNLSHAVQIYGYELFKTLAGVQPVAGQWIPMNSEQIGALARSITNSLESLGFYKQQGREYQERFFHDVFSRAGLSEREGRYMSDIFAKAVRMNTHRAE
ncbi:MAG: RNA methyltransferase [Treponema sp.]|nr:RNA methyltransferase [Treponema sp.]